ncbi:MAG TPA: hypothetical protein DEQ80_08935 [Anaerolinea thermolimosa]|uniref:Uncharacterized protein n=1 Tax=Anaerolinea thermolimosa TaxID=229919 RepID=A0A3D1JHC3_9CHLR|nr:hypothetical protein [Anaerolinea thermolimosa]
MYKTLAFILVIALAFGFVPAAQAATQTLVIPTIDIVSVIVDSSVTVKTNNFPAHDQFDVTMNVIGTKGVGGVKVATVDSGSGGSLTFTFTIPDSLKGLAQIAIRLQSPTSGYYAYNWFTNKTGGSTGGPVTPDLPGGVIPTFSITSVEKDSKVTITTANFPKNDTFEVLMNKYGTRGVGGTKVDSVSSGSGGTLTFTFAIPDGLKGLDRIAIRLQSPTSGYFAYNWFWNAPGTAGSPGTPLPAGVVPTFSISAVVKDATVTIKTANFPAGDHFDVYMNTYGTKGIGGNKVATIDSGSGGTLTFTFNIPDGLKGLDRIAIRTQSPTSGYYSYNWFWNNTYP